MDDKSAKTQHRSVFPYLLLGCVGLLILIQAYQSGDSQDEGSRAQRSGDATTDLSSRDVNALANRLSSQSDALTEQFRGQLKRKTAEYTELKAENVDLQRQVLELQARLDGNAKDGGGESESRDTAEFLKQMAELTSNADSELKAFQDELDRQAAAFIKQQVNVERERATQQIADLERSHRDEMATTRDSFEQELDAVLDESSAFQYATARAFIRVGASAVPALTEALRDNTAAVRAWSAYVLGELGADAQSAVPALIQAQSDRDESVRAAATRALSAVSDSVNR